MRRLVLDSATKKVVNALVADEGFLLPDGQEWAPQHDGDIGDTWNGSGWTERDHPAPPQITLAEAQASRLSQIRSEAEDLITTKWPLFRQLNADAGIYPTSVKDEKDADVVAVISASNAAEDAVAAATTVAEVKAVSAVWPVL